MDEKELIRRSKEGHIESFEKLIELHEQRVYNISLKMLKNEQDAFDASQEALLKAFKYISLGSAMEESIFPTDKISSEITRFLLSKTSKIRHSR